MRLAVCGRAARNEALAIHNAASQFLSAYFRRPGTTLKMRAFNALIKEAAAMATNTGSFFVGVGTTFAILAVGFGGGLMMAKTALQPRAEQQARAPHESVQPVRVILPASAEPAQPPQPSTTTVAEQPMQPAPAAPVKEASVPEKTLEKVDTRKAEAEERERRKRYAERKARRLAERAKRKQQIEQGEPRNASIMAFGGDEPRQSGGFGLFGN